MGVTDVVGPPNFKMDIYLHTTKANHAILTMIGCSGVLNLPSSEIGFVLSPLSSRFLTIPLRISQIKPKVILQQFSHAMNTLTCSTQTGLVSIKVLFDWNKDSVMTTCDVRELSIT